MKSIAQPPPAVKTFKLFIDNKNRPYLEHPDGNFVPVPDSFFGRWFLRTRYKDIKPTKQARAWYLEQNPAQLPPINFLLNPPQEHQILSVNRMLISNCALWLDMGLGKTFITIALSLKLLEEGVGNYFLIICPLSCAITWEDELKIHVDPKSQYQFVFAHGPEKKKLIQQLRMDKPKTPVFVITTYDTAKTLLTDLSRLPFVSITLDESSKIKNPETQRTAALYSLRDKLPLARRYLLSGTPSTTKPLGFYAQYEFLGRGWSGHDNYVAFTHHYTTSLLFMRCRLPNGQDVHVACEPDKTDPVTQEITTAPERWLRSNFVPNTGFTYKQQGYSFDRKSGPKTIRILNTYTRVISVKNIPELNRITQRNAYSLKKEDVLTKLPKKYPIRRTVKMTAEQKKLYDAAVGQLRGTLNNIKFSFSGKSPFAKLHQIANGFLIQNNQATFLKKNNKLIELLSILEEAGDQSLFVWAPFPAYLEHAAEFLRKHGHTVATIHGGTSIADRKESVHGFQDKKIRVLLGNPDVAGMGLNLTVCSLTVFLTNWFKPDMRNQAIDRFHRMGQKNDVTIIDLLTEGTIEPKILKDLNSKTITENKILKLTDLTGKDLA